MKKVVAVVKLQLPAGKATPAPPVGPALGQHGANIMEFVKAFNAATANMGDAIVPVEITIYADRSFTFITKTPPVSYLIRKAAGLEKGAHKPGREKVGRITWQLKLYYRNYLLHFSLLGSPQVGGTNAS